MSIVNLNGLSVSENSLRRARKIVENKPQNGRKSIDDVLASLRQMKPGWNISMSSADWGEGFRNIEIGSGVLNRMAECSETMVRYKALILDLEDVVPELEEWAENNEGESLQFRIILDGNGITKAEGLVRTLLGGEKRTTFELNTNANSWSSLIQQKLEALQQGRAENAEGERSWLG